MNTERLEWRFKILLLRVLAWIIRSITAVFLEPPENTKEMNFKWKKEHLARDGEALKRAMERMVVEIDAELIDLRRIPSNTAKIKNGETDE